MTIKGFWQLNHGLQIAACDQPHLIVEKLRLHKAKHQRRFTRAHLCTASTQEFLTLGAQPKGTFPRYLDSNPSSPGPTWAACHAPDSYCAMHCGYFSWNRSRRPDSRGTCSVSYQHTSYQPEHKAGKEARLLGAQAWLVAELVVFDWRLKPHSCQALPSPTSRPADGEHRNKSREMILRVRYPKIIMYVERFSARRTRNSHHGQLEDTHTVTGNSCKLEGTADILGLYEANCTRSIISTRVCGARWLWQQHVRSCELPLEHPPFLLARPRLLTRLSVNVAVL